MSDYDHDRGGQHRRDAGRRPPPNERLGFLVTGPPPCKSPNGGRWTRARERAYLKETMAWLADNLPDGGPAHIVIHPDEEAPHTGDD